MIYLSYIGNYSLLLETDLVQIFLVALTTFQYYLLWFKIICYYSENNFWGNSCYHKRAIESYKRKKAKERMLSGKPSVNLAQGKNIVAGFVRVSRNIS